MFPVRYVAQLIGQYESVAYVRIDIAVRVTIYPIINTAIGYKRAQLYRESTIDGTVLKFWCRAQLCGNMMRKDDNPFSLTFQYGLLDECETTLVCMVEIVCCQPMSIVHNAVEVTNIPLGQVCIIRFYLRP